MISGSLDVIPASAQKTKIYAITLGMQPKWRHGNAWGRDWQHACQHGWLFLKKGIWPVQRDNLPSMPTEDSRCQDHLQIRTLSWWPWLLLWSLPEKQVWQGRAWSLERLPMMAPSLPWPFVHHSLQYLYYSFIFQPCYLKYLLHCWWYLMFNSLFFRAEIIQFNFWGSG